MQQLFVLVLAFFLIQGNAWSQRNPEFLLGGDISALRKMEELGMTYYDDGQPAPAEQVMSNHGANVYRLRLFVQPTRKGLVVQDLPYVIDLAKRIKKTGAKLILTLHYSDTWTNPVTQSKPADWQDLDFDKLVEKVRSYTKDVISEMNTHGVMPDYVAIGNEIRSGFLWPDGKIDGSTAQWKKFGTLINAAIQGITDSGQRDAIKIILHVHGGESPMVTGPFYGMAEKLGIKFDVIGVSFYPWWGAFEKLGTNLDHLGADFGKEILILETAYLYKPHVDSRWPITRWQWPHTPCGQWQYFQDLILVAESSASGKVNGIVWWFPEAAERQGLHVWLAGSAALFDGKGRPLPAMRLLEGASPENSQESPSECVPD